MRNPAVRVEPTRAPSAATARAGSRGVIRLAEVGASAVVRRGQGVVGLEAVVAVIASQRIGVLLTVDREI